MYKWWSLILDETIKRNKNERILQLLARQSGCVFSAANAINFIAMQRAQVAKWMDQWRAYTQTDELINVKGRMWNVVVEMPKPKQIIHFQFKQCLMCNKNGWGSISYYDVCVYYILHVCLNVSMLLMIMIMMMINLDMVHYRRTRCIRKRINGYTMHTPNFDMHTIDGGCGGGSGCILCSGDKKKKLILWWNILFTAQFNILCSLLSL